MNNAITSSGQTNFVTLASQPNLYFYFVNYSWHYLNPQGRAGLILSLIHILIYDSWLYSDFGKFLKESILKLGYLDSIYHFKKSAFDNVEVGATVIKFVKDKNHKMCIRDRQSC